MGSSAYSTDMVDKEMIPILGWVQQGGESFVMLHRTLCTLKLTNLLLGFPIQYFQAEVDYRYLKPQKAINKGELLYLPGIQPSYQ